MQLDSNQTVSGKTGAIHFVVDDQGVLSEARFVAIS